MTTYNHQTQPKELVEAELQELRKILNKSIETASLAPGFDSYVQVANKLKDVKRELNTRYISKRGL